MRSFVKDSYKSMFLLLHGLKLENMSMEYAEKNSELSFTCNQMFTFTKELTRYEKYHLLVFAIWHFLYFLQN